MYAMLGESGRRGEGGGSSQYNKTKLMFESFLSITLLHTCHEQDLGTWDTVPQQLPPPLLQPPNYIPDYVHKLIVYYLSATVGLYIPTSTPPTPPF